MLQLDAQGLLRCLAPRKRQPAIECQTTIARPSGERLEIRCRNCGHPHVFVVRDGQIVPEAVRVDSGGAHSLAS